MSLQLYKLKWHLNEDFIWKQMAIIKILCSSPEVLFKLVPVVRLDNYVVQFLDLSEHIKWKPKITPKVDWCGGF
jgi:hypothetical protein